VIFAGKDFKKGILIVLVVIFIASNLAAQGLFSGAVVTYVKGRVQVKKSGEISWIKAVKDMKLNIGDTIRTRRRSKAIVNLGTKAKLKLGQLTTIVISPKNVDINNITDIKLEDGALLSKVRKPAKFEVETPNAVAGVRGTQFIVEYIKRLKMTKLVVIDGKVLLSTLKDIEKKTAKLVEAAQKSVAVEDYAPSTPSATSVESELRKYGFEEEKEKTEGPKIELLKPKRGMWEHPLLVEGRVTGEGIKEVLVLVKNKVVKKIPVRNGMFKGKVKLLKPVKKIRVVCKDKYGKSAGVEVGLAPLKKEINIILNSPQEGQYQDPLKVSGTVDDESVKEVGILIDNKPIGKLPVKNGSFDGEFKLNGMPVNKVKVVCKNQEGKIGVAEVTLVAQQQGAFQIILMKPQPGIFEDPLIVEGTVTSNTVSKVEVYADAAFLDYLPVVDGRFFGTFRISKDTKLIKVSAHDSDGNVSKAEVSLQVEGAAGEIEIIVIKPTEGEFSDPLEIEGQVLDPDVKEVEIFVDGIKKGILPVNETGKFFGKIDIGAKASLLKIIAKNPQGMTGVKEVPLISTQVEGAFEIILAQPIPDKFTDPLIIEGTVTDSTVSYVEVFAGSIKLATIPVQNGSFSGSVSLEGKSNVVKVTAKNANGEVAVAEVSDNLPPTVIIVSPIEDMFPVPIRVEGTVDDDSVREVEIVAAGRVVTVPVENGSFAAELNVKSAIISVRAMDPAGNIGTASISDTKPPHVVITYPVDRQQVNVTELEEMGTDKLALHITGLLEGETGIPSVKIKINLESDKIYQTDGTNFDAVVPIGFGTVNIKVSAEDGGGNIGSETVTIYMYDPDPPIVELLSPVDGSYTASGAYDLKVTGSIIEDYLKTAKVYLTGTAFSRVYDLEPQKTAPKNYVFDKVFPVRAIGDIKVEVKAEDMSGKTTTVTRNLSITLTPPAGFPQR